MNLHFLTNHVCSLQQNPPTCDNDILSYADMMSYAFTRRRRRDVSDDVISSRHRRAVEGFTSDGMEVSIEIGSATDQNTSSTQGGLCLEMEIKMLLFDITILHVMLVLKLPEIFLVSIFLFKLLAFLISIKIHILIIFYQKKDIN